MEWRRLALQSVTFLWVCTVVKSLTLDSISIQLGQKGQQLPTKRCDVDVNLHCNSPFSQAGECLTQQTWLFANMILTSRVRDVGGERCWVILFWNVIFTDTLVCASKAPTCRVKLYTAVPSDHRCRNIDTSLVAVSYVNVAAILGRSRPAC